MNFFLINKIKASIYLIPLFSLLEIQQYFLQMSSKRAERIQCNNQAYNNDSIKKKIYVLKCQIEKEMSKIKIRFKLLSDI